MSVEMHTVCGNRTTKITNASIELCSAYWSEQVMIEGAVIVHVYECISQQS